MQRIFFATLILATHWACTEPEPTWNEDVREIVQNNCIACHYDGAAAPFAFHELEDVRTASQAMLDAMKSKRMPPWPADPSCRSFHGERLMPQEEIDLFEKWVNADMPTGQDDQAISFTPPVFESNQVLSAVNPYTPELSSVGDDYRCFFLDAEFSELSFLKGATVLPDSPAVHHVIVFALEGDQVDQARALEAAEEGEGYTCFGSALPAGASGAASPVNILGWAPGSEPVVFPDGFARPIAAGTRLVMQIHYSASGGAPQPDHTSVLINIDNEVPTSIVRGVPLVVRGIDIPAGDDNARFEVDFKNHSQNAYTITSVSPHMHLLGTSVDAIHVSDENESCAISIPDWDFDWQLDYAFHPGEEMAIAPGDTLRVSCTYDNSAENQAIVNGVQRQPVDVQWGEGSLDEMCIVFANMVLPYSEENVRPAICSDAAACFAQSEGTLSDLLSCERSTPCVPCLLSNALECGLGACVAPLSQMRDCLTNCTVATSAFGGKPDDCMRESCAAEYAAFTECADPIVAAEQCESTLTACGL